MAAVCSKAVILLLVSLFNVALVVCGGGSSRLFYFVSYLVCQTSH